ncbi:MAG: MCP four helix bundle domain-containing protein [Sphaerochaeta sp.]|nr:MCP four helix bundle domain-containing protein [Sphaerochaeta sp.]
MKLKERMIARQLSIYIGGVVVIVLILIATSIFSVEALWKDTSGIFNNPLAVRRAIGEIRADVLLIHRDMRQLPYEDNQEVIEHLINNIGMYEANISQQLPIL